MYKNKRSRFHRGDSGFRKNNFYRGGRGNMRVKTFDPTNLVNNLNTIPFEPHKEIEFVPQNRFTDFKIDQRLQANISKKGYTSPTPIQDRTIPELLDGHDVVGIARTGTGKTAAFLIPLINKALQNPRERVLILAPTRELAVQIREEFVTFSERLNIYSALCIGGVGMHGQIKILRRNPQFVIGTPGRIKDLEKHRALNLSNFRTVVLDEVDRMLDMGFIHDVEDIIRKLAPVRHSLFFSATVTDKVETIMRKFLKNPVTIKIESNTPTTYTSQQIIKVGGRSKFEVLYEMLSTNDFEKVLIFGRTKHGVERLSRQLIDKGFRAASIHGNKNQNQRQRALNDFKSGYNQILLATSVASRGLDINNVTHVINYDLPESYEDYVHRIGRTGRAGKHGNALTFVD